MHLLEGPDLGRSTNLLGGEKGKKRRRKSPAPGGIWTHDLSRNCHDEQFGHFTEQGAMQGEVACTYRWPPDLLYRTLPSRQKFKSILVAQKKNQSKRNPHKQGNWM